MIRSQTCPICSKAVSIESPDDAALFPFCSERCRQVDLLRWCEGKYAIVEPAQQQDLESELPDVDL